MAKKSITLLKLGGAIITNKDVPMSLRGDVLTDLVTQIAKYRQENPTELMVIGHGQGSFAHLPATKYRTMDGFINEESVFGMAVVQDSAAQLNRLVVHECIRHEIPAVTLAPSNTLITAGRKPDQAFLSILEAYLSKGLCPITGGDVLVDAKQGCTIWSTEEVLAFFAKELQTRQFTVNKILHITEVAGVLDQQGQVIPRLTPQNWPGYRAAIGGTKGFDVTGGMLLKVQESIDLLAHGVESYILSGLTKHNVYKALSGDDWVGTRVCEE
jgi:isopentenyl phosphate kinase